MDALEVRTERSIAAKERLKTVLGYMAPVPGLMKANTTMAKRNYRMSLPNR